MNTMATHLVILASLASQVLALFLDRKVSTPLNDGAGQAALLPDWHDHGDQDQAAQKLNDGEGELHINIVPFRPVQTGEKSKCGGKSRTQKTLYYIPAGKARIFPRFGKNVRRRVKAGRWPPDLHQHVLGQAGHLDGGAGGIGLLEELGVDLVHGGEVVHIVENTVVLTTACPCWSRRR